MIKQGFVGALVGGLTVAVFMVNVKPDEKIVQEAAVQPEEVPASVQAAPPKSSDPVETAGNIALDRDGWSVFARHGEAHSMSVDRGVVSLSGVFLENHKTSACLKERLPIDGETLIQGRWTVELDTADRYASLGARFFDGSDKMVIAKRATHLVVTTGESTEWVDFGKRIAPPDGSKSMQLCIEFKAHGGRMALTALSVLSGEDVVAEDSGAPFNHGPQIPVAHQLVVVAPDGTEGRIVNRRNERRRTDELVLYTAEHGLDTRQNELGIEVAVERGLVSAVRQYGDLEPIPIPLSGYVLSGSGMASSYLKRYAVGDRVRLMDSAQCLAEQHAVPVLVYHQLEVDGTVDSVDAQFRQIRESGYSSISLEQLDRWMEGLDEALPTKPIVLTFDDGKRQHFERLPEMLERHDLRGVLFLIMTHLDHPFERYFGWDQARELVATGRFDLECHSYDAHRKVTGAEGEEAGAYMMAASGQSTREHHRWQQRDLAQCRNRLFAETGQNSRYIAWPFGQYDNALIGTAARAGFEGMLTVHEGVNGPGTPAHVIRRMSVSPDMEWKDIEARIRQWRVCPISRDEVADVAPFSDYGELTSG